MNKFTIILLTSLVTLIQITNALPMHEVPTAEEPTNKKGSDNSPRESESDSEHQTKEISDTLNSKCESESESESEDQGYNEHNYNDVEDFVRETIRDYYGEHIEIEAMSKESLRQLHEMFYEMNIIRV